jgi:hypothetical protein
VDLDCAAAPAEMAQAAIAAAPKSPALNPIMW